MILLKRKSFMESNRKEVKFKEAFFFLLFKQYSRNANLDTYFLTSSHLFWVFLMYVTPGIFGSSWISWTERRKGRLFTRNYKR